MKLHSEACEIFWYISTVKNFYGTSMKYLWLFLFLWGDMASLILDVVMIPLHLCSKLEPSTEGGNWILKLAYLIILNCMHSKENKFLL